MLDLDISEFSPRRPPASALPGYKPRPAGGGVGPRHRPGHPGPRHAGGRGRHRHRQDLGVSCTRVHPGRQGADFHRTRAPCRTNWFSRDLPRVRAALAAPVTAALLKGRGNYVCHYHLDRLQGDERALKSRAEIQQLRQIQVFAGISKSGDRSDLAQVPEDADIWQRVTSTRENCLGQGVPAHWRLFRGQGAPPGPGG